MLITRLFFISFYLHFYLSNSQESDEVLYIRQANYPDLLPEMPRYCCLIESFNFIEICKNHQAAESAVKCLSHGRNIVARVGFESRLCWSQSQRF